MSVIDFALCNYYNMTKLKENLLLPFMNILNDTILSLYSVVLNTFIKSINQSINQARQFLTCRNTAKPLQGRNRTRPPRPTL